MILRVWVVLSLGLASAAQADGVCQFDQACTLDGSDCTDAKQTFTYKTEGEARWLRSGTDAARLFQPLKNKRAKSYVFDDPSYWEVFEIDLSGRAMLSIGGDGPGGAFAYVGTCEDAP